MGGDIGRALFRCTVHIAGDLLAMPVQQFGCVGVVDHIDRDALPLLEAQQWPRKLPIIKRGRNDLIWRQLD